MKSKSLALGVLVICALLISNLSHGQNVFINSLKYSGTDQVEIVGPAGIDFSCYTIVPYNQAGSAQTSATFLMTGTAIDCGSLDPNDMQWEYATVTGFAAQGGDDDGVALVNTCTGNTVVQFIEYEDDNTANSGTLIAIGGLADGAVAGISLTGSTDGFSLSGLTSGSPLAEDYTNSEGNFTGCNAGQTFGMATCILPIVAVSSNSPVCIGEDIELTASFTSEGSSTTAAIWSWTGPNSFSSTMEDPIAFASTTLVAGTYTVEVTDNNGCKNTSDVEVVVNDLPNVVTSNNSPVCEGEEIELAASFTANGLSLSAASWAWSGPNSFSSTVEDPPAFTSMAAVMGPYTVTVIDNNGCINTAETSVVVEVLPPCIITGDVVVCEGDGINLTETDTGRPGGNWDWAGPGGYSSTSSAGGITITDATTANSGTYTVIVTDLYDSGASCQSVCEVEVTVNSLPTPDLTKDSDFTCISRNDKGVIDGYGGIVFTASGGTMYEFFIDADRDGILESIQTQSTTATISYDPVIFLGTGSLEVHVVVTDVNGCSAVAFTSFDVYEFPNPGVLTNFEACTGDIDLDDLLTADFTAGGDWRIISTPAGVSITLDGNNAASFAAGNYTINYEISTLDKDGNPICGTSIDHPFEVHALPEVVLDVTSQSCDDLDSGTITLTNSGFPMPATYAWSNSSSGQSISDLAVGTYTVTVTDANMCSNTFSAEVLAADGCSFDVALDKKVTTPGPYVPGQNVTFTITVYNQGSVDAHNIDVVDYLPAGYIFNAADNTNAPNDWVINGNGDPQHTVTSIEFGLSTIITITLQIDPDYAGASLLNTAEIIGATNEAGMDQADEDSDLADTEPDPDGEIQNDVADDGDDNEDDEDDFDFAGICIDVQITISGDATICNTGDADITFVITGGTAPYSIMYGDGTTTTTTDQTTITVSPTETTIYTIVAVTDANGCPATVSGSATITVGNTSCTEFPWTGNE